MTSTAAARAGLTERRSHALIDAHFRGHVSPGGEREMRVHLMDCGECRAYYERHLRLSLVDPGTALPAGERLARGLGLSRARPAARGKRRWFGFAALAATCAVAFVVAGRGRPPGEPQPRGTSAPGSQLFVYEIAKGGAARAVITDLHADSGLAFAYANIGHRQRLMVFAVDESRRVHWYHPGWQNPAEDPIALAIERDDAIHEIPEAIAHPFTRRRLQLFGAFLDRAMSVREMEALIARAPIDEQQRIQLSVAGADVVRLDLTVVPAR